MFLCSMEAFTDRCWGELLPQALVVSGKPVSDQVRVDSKVAY